MLPGVIPGLLKAFPRKKVRKKDKNINILCMPHGCNKQTQFSKNVRKLVPDADFQLDLVEK